MNNKTTEDLMEKFLSFEFDNNLFNSKVFKTKFWHLIRFGIFNQIQETHFEVGQAHTNLENTSKIKKVLLKFKQVNHFILNNPLFSFKQKDILILNHVRRVKEDTHYTCLYTDLLIDHLEYSNVVLEEPLLEKHMKPPKHDRILYTDYINFIVAIRKRLFRKKLTLEDKGMIKDLTINLNNTFDTNFKFINFEALIYNEVISFKYRVKYYKKILRRIKPKVIIEVVSYSTSRFVINHVAKELNIPTIELQHGTMGKYHLAYNFKVKMNLFTFPDYVFTFGQFWKDNTRFPIYDENIKVIGWPFFEKKVDYYLYKKKQNYKQKNILFISQGTIGAKLSMEAVALRKLISNEYKITYKLHPGEYVRWKKEYPWLLNSEVEVIDHNNNDMHYYFANADIQVGVYSTALFEGIAYNLPTFIFPLFGHVYLENLIRNGIVKSVSSSENLYEFISEIGYEDADKNINIKEYLWCNNSLDKMVKEISSIIEKK